MYIKSLKIKDFRNYEVLDLEFDKKVNIIIGSNAQGKTNLLESIYISSLGRSFIILQISTCLMN
jgi:DNA replication and repair protein RecF